MTFSQHQKASQEELDQLALLVRRVDKVQKFRAAEEATVTEEPQNPTPSEKINDYSARNSLFAGGIANVIVTREPVRVDNPVQLLLMLMPELTPYKWQFEELMRCAGYMTTGKYEPGDKTEVTVKNPLRLVLAAANGSGKDAVLIAAFSVWFAISGLRNRVIITSSSFVQLKSQTEIHIRRLINLANQRFGPLFKSIHFHHIVPELGSEIKLFATDDPGLAEGYHAFYGGKMARIINEAKTVTDDIMAATDRWRGVSHTLLVSSPGRRRGKLFTIAGNAVHYPAAYQPGSWYFRKVTAHECPHIPNSLITEQMAEHGEFSPFIRSSIFAEFSDYDEPIVIPRLILDACIKSPPLPTGDDIGIGLDLAAGGDEDACFVRKGNKIIYEFFFRQGDTDLSADLIDNHLSPWKNGDYSFNADNGGVGRGILDKLVPKGWRINRCNNQSPALNKREYLNLGAETWMHLRRLIERRVIIIPPTFKLTHQLASRYFASFADGHVQGKCQLESKKKARLNGHASPDRADAFVLCFWSYKVSLYGEDKPTVVTRERLPLAEFIAKYSNGLPTHQPRTGLGRFTLLNQQLHVKGR